jgi:hypothetical protein
VKVLVGDSCLAGSPARYWSDRIPETLGRGGFLIHPEVQGLEGQHPSLVTYPLGDFAVLRDKIDDALDDAEFRMVTAALARQGVLDRHLYEHRLERLLATVLG